MGRRSMLLIAFAVGALLAAAAGLAYYGAPHVAISIPEKVP